MRIKCDILTTAGEEEKYTDPWKNYFTRKEEHEVSQGYGVSKKHAKALSVENPQEYVFKHKYHLVPKLNGITDEMLTRIITQQPEKYFEYKFHMVPQFKDKNDAAFRHLLRKDPLELIRTKAFAKTEFKNWLILIFEMAIKTLGWHMYDLNKFSNKLRKLEDKRLSSGLYDLAFFLKTRQPDYFYQTLLVDDPNFGRVFGPDEVVKKRMRKSKIGV